MLKFEKFFKLDLYVWRMYSSWTHQQLESIPTISQIIDIENTLVSNLICTNVPVLVCRSSCDPS